MNNFKKPFLVMALAVSLSLGTSVSFVDNENNKSETSIKAILGNSSKIETTKMQVKLDENNKVISNKDQNGKEEEKEAEVKSQKSAKTGRIDAQNRFETVKKIKGKEFKNADTVVIVNSNEFSDSASTTDISNGKSPILYIDSNRLDNLTKGALNSIKKVYITGGEKTISSKVVKELDGSGIKVIKVKGKDRYDVNTKPTTTSHPVPNKKQNVVIASGESFTDSISSTSLTKKKNAPILLVKKDEVPKSIKEYLNSFRKKGLLGDITIVSGKNSASKTTENELSRLVKVTRIAGNDRYQTSIKVVKHVGVNSERTIVASGEKFVDVLAASPVTQECNAPIVLIKKMDVPRNEDYKTGEQEPSSVESLFRQSKSKIMHTMIFDSKNAIGNFVVSGIRSLLAGKSLQAKPKVDALVDLPKKQEQRVQEETNKLDKIVELAYKQLGRPYVWGAHGPRSLNCSGLTSLLYKQAYDIEISMNSRAQTSYGYKVPRSSSERGDLMFFAADDDGVSHIGIYVGNNKLIHASTPSTGVILSDISSSYYQRTFVTARRLSG